jgi:hypothetical protein
MSKNFIFSGFTPSVTGRHWHSNAHEWLILDATLQYVIFSSFLYIVDNNPVLIWHIFLYDAALSPKQIDGFVAHLFDRSMPIAHPGSVLLPYNSDNPPLLVRVFDFFKSFPDLWSYESILIINEDIYPAHPVDAELSDSNQDG